MEPFAGTSVRLEIAKIQFFQISHTIDCMHSKNVCHKDLKLENILLMDLGPTGLVKVTDFCLSKQFSSTNLLETFVARDLVSKLLDIDQEGEEADRSKYLATSGSRGTWWRGAK